MSRKHSRVPESLEAMYEPEEFDTKLAAVVLESVAKAHPANADPDIILDRASRITASLGHLAGAAEFAGGIDALLESGMFTVRFADFRSNPLVRHEPSPITR